MKAGLYSMRLRELGVAGVGSATPRNNHLHVPSGHGRGTHPRRATKKNAAAAAGSNYPPWPGRALFICSIVALGGRDGTARRP